MNDVRIGFIGAGKVGTVFGRYLHSAGVTIGGYCDHHPRKAARAAAATGSRVCETADEVVAVSNLVLITTRDDQIEGVAREFKGSGVDGRYLVGHMSGAHSSRILAAVIPSGAGVFSLHPLQAFAEENNALRAMSRTCFTLEGSDERTATLQLILEQAGNRVFRIQPDDKSLYHLSACILSNYLVTLVAGGLEVLGSTGIEPDAGLRAMIPMIEGTLSNIVEMGPAKALTGPIARGDSSTVALHLRALESRGLSGLKQFYSFMALRTIALCEANGTLEPAQLAALKQTVQRS